MSTRDESPRAASQSSLRSSMRRGSSPTLSASTSATAERERRELKEQLAAWKERKQQPPRQPTTPTTPKPFRASASSGPSDEEKRLLLQRRRELMRAPSKSPQKPARRASSQDLQGEASSPVNSNTSGSSASMRAASPVGNPVSGIASPVRMREKIAPPPRTPPRRPAHQDVPRAMRPPPPQTPPLAPRTPPSSVDRMRMSQLQVEKVALREPSSGADSGRPQPLVIEPMNDDQDALTEDEPDQSEPPSSTSPEVAEPHHLPQSPPLLSLPMPAIAESDRVSGDSEISAIEVADELHEPRAAFSPPPSLAASVRSVDSSPPSGLSSLSSISQIVEASPRKQVRFADQNNDASVEQAPVADTLGPNDATLDGPSDGSVDDQPENQLSESQSSFEREMTNREVLMNEVDELIHLHSGGVLITDTALHGHRTAAKLEHDDEVIVKNQVDVNSFTTAAETTVATILQQDEQSEIHAPSNQQVDIVADQEIPSVDNRCADVGPQNGDNTERHPVRLRVVKSPVSASADRSSSYIPSPLHRSAIAPIRRLHKVLIVSVAAGGLLLLGLAYPKSPISRGLRVVKRVAIGLASHVGSSVASWLWHAVCHPGLIKISRILLLSNTWLQPQAEALQSLVDTYRSGLLDVSSEVPLKAEWIWGHRHELQMMFMHGAKSAFKGVSSAIANVVLYVTSPLMQPLPTIDSETTAAAQNRLEELTAAQAELRLKVKELLRTQEEWAVEELERMKQRRVAYATATNAILTETTKFMLQAVQEAKLSVASQIQEFSDQLTQELMSSLQPELSEYERFEADQSTELALRDDLRKAELQEAARLEIFHVESAKKEADAKAREQRVEDQKLLSKEKVFVEVDIMEVVETVEDIMVTDVDAAANTLIGSLEQTVQEVQGMTSSAETELQVVVEAVGEVIERAETRLADGLAASIEERGRELKREHDAAEAEIDRLAANEVKRLQIERRAAEELARATLLAEEAVKHEVEEARRALDVQLEAGKMELELELENAAEVAVNIDVVEVEKIVVVEEVIMEAVEAAVIGEVEQLARDIAEDVALAVERGQDAKAKLVEIEEAAEASLEQLTLEESKRLEQEQHVASARLNAVALDTEQRIASGANIELPQSIGSHAQVTSPLLKTNATSESLRSIVEDVERRHMAMLSVGFILLAAVAALALYPRWRRLVANPSREIKAVLSSAERRRRRRSWQRPAQLSDSEPEEVMLLQTGSSNEDGLSDTNEPEPEVVEQFGGADTPGAMAPMSYTRSTRLSYTAYSRMVDYTGGDDESEGTRDDEFATPPTQRAVRRRRG